MRHLYLSILLALLWCAPGARAQSPGFIIIKPTGTGQAVLDPNNDGFTSVTSRGFISNDVSATETELPFKMVRPFYYEPVGDLLRGPSGRFSDIVSGPDSSGFYVYCSGGNMIFRIRIGSHIPGSKGYSVLIDTDGRMGNVGANADPGYTYPLTSHHKGNPGFELEVCLETNFRVAVYNVDTPGKVVLKYANTPVTAYSQISVAKSATSGDPDYFYDFYVPYAQLGINTNTPLRMIATTVMAPQSAIGGPRSDIYGMNNGTSDDFMFWSKAVTYQSPVSGARLSAPTMTTTQTCTEAPSVTAPAVGATLIAGSWSRLDGLRSNTAKIRLYRNNVLVDSVWATSGVGWNFTVSTIVATDAFYATAQGVSEGACFRSNTVVPVICNGALSARPAITCATPKGIDGTNAVSGTRIRIYKNVVPGVTMSGYQLFADSALAPGNFNSVTTPFVLQDNVLKQWKCDGTDGNGQPGVIGNSACSGGNTNDMPLNTALAVTAQEPGKCESMPVFICPNGTVTATPGITETVLYPGGAVTVTGGASSFIRIYVDSVLKGYGYADANGVATFGSLGLTTGRKVEVCAQSSAATCVSAFATRTVSCTTSLPKITTDKDDNIALGATTIAGKSFEANGATVTVFKKLLPSGATSLVSSAQVSNGAWSMNVPAALANERYVAVQQTGTCAMSDSSGYAYVPTALTTSCPSFGAVSYLSNVPAVGGSVAPALTNGTVYLYIDGTLADSATGVTNAFSIPVNTGINNKLYAGSVLTATARTSGGAEKTDCNTPTSATVNCTTPSAPTYSVTSVPPYYVNDSISLAINNTNSSLLYTVVDAPDTGKAYATAAYGTSGTLNTITYPFTATGDYTLAVRTVNISEGSTCQTTTQPTNLRIGNAALPVRLLSFGGRLEQGKAMLYWEAADEKDVRQYGVERSEDGKTFRTIGTQEAVISGAISRYSFKDGSSNGSRSFYRLRTVEVNGEATYSHVILLTGEATAAAPLISPNPFNQQLNIILTASSDGQAQLRLLDMTGRLVRQQPVTLIKGTNAVSVYGLGALQPGRYQVQLLQQGTLTTIPVEKLP